MIRTMTAATVEELDLKVNSFMKERKQNLPVRTETYQDDGKTMQKATIFWDEKFVDNRAFGPEGEIREEELGDVSWQPQKGSVSKEEVELDMNINEAKRSSSDKLGALWLQKDGSVSGTFQKQKVSFPETASKRIKALQEGDVLDTTMNGIKVVVMRNKFKETLQHPDWVVLKRREE